MDDILQKNTLLTDDTLSIRVFNTIIINGNEYSYLEVGTGRQGRGVNIRPLGIANQEAYAYWVTNFQHNNRYTNNHERFYRELIEEVVAAAGEAAPQLPTMNLNVRTHALGETVLRYDGRIAIENFNNLSSTIENFAFMEKETLNARLSFIEHLELDFSMLESPFQI